jgi:tRNA1Val (adenine37-N6)-methyltransferase
MFRFKQFSVDQSGCAMKINTDGVLLGAVAEADNPASILDIGTGTGVIALMLAQRFINAEIEAVEIDTIAAQTAERNFAASSFSNRLTAYAMGFEDYFNQSSEKKFDLIVSNPPFYIDSLKSPGAKKTLAKHTDVVFFERLIESISKHLTLNGSCWLIVPVNLGEIIISLASDKNMFPVKLIYVQSYLDSSPHRVILCLGHHKNQTEISDLTIYETKKVYSEKYKKLLQPYFLAF